MLAMAKPRYNTRKTAEMGTSGMISGRPPMPAFGEAYGGPGGFCDVCICDMMPAFGGYLFFSVAAITLCFKI